LKISLTCTETTNKEKFEISLATVEMKKNGQCKISTIKLGWRNELSRFGIGSTANFETIDFFAF